MIDTHTHLDLCDGEPAELVASAQRAGVRRLLNIGLDAPSCRRALKLAETMPSVWAAVGRHPNSCAGFDDGDLDELRLQASHPRCLAIGETGLDHYRQGAPAADQERALRAHLDLAREVTKPVVIHSRAADDQTIAMLRSHAGDLDVVLHCFSMPERLEECLAEGWLVSFAGNVTYPSSGALADACVRVPEDRLLVETDAPFLTPQPHRGQRNRPALVTETARFLADRRGVTYEELEATVEANAARLLGW